MLIWIKYLKKVIGKDFTKSKKNPSMVNKADDPLASFGHLLSDFILIAYTIIQVV
jgi:hypothetical protein